jgi:hypothetical protein
LLNISSCTFFKVNLVQDGLGHGSPLKVTYAGMGSVSENADCAESCQNYRYFTPPALLFSYAVKVVINLTKVYHNYSFICLSFLPYTPALLS